MRVITTALTFILAALMSAGALGQTVDADAAKAFDRMIEAHRKAPSIEVDCTMKIELEQSGASSTGEEAGASFVRKNDGKGIFKTGGYTLFMDGEYITAIHETNDDAYYSMQFTDYPYWGIFNTFYQFDRIPFPHLAILFGSSVPEDLYMELYADTPELVPTAFTEREEDGKPVQTIELTGKDAAMQIDVNPETMLIQSIEHRITSGRLVPEGATRTNQYTFEYTLHDKPLPDETFHFDRGDRQRVDVLASLDRSDPEPDIQQSDGPRPRPRGGMIGEDAPVFTLSDLEGNRVSLADLKGQVIVIDFWATWCQPCVKGLPKLHAVHDWAKEENLPVTFLAINTWEMAGDPGDNPERRRVRAERFWNDNEFAITVLMDSVDTVAEAYRLGGIPATFVIGPDGVISAQHAGLGANYEEQLKREISEALSM